MTEEDTKKEEENKEQTETQEPQQQAEKPQQEESEQEDPVEKNWKAVREKRKEEERLRKEQERKLAEKEEMIKAMEELLHKQNQTQQNQEPQKDENGFDIHPEEWVTGKQLQSILEKDREERKKFEEKTKQEKQQLEMKQKLNDRYPDYDQVLNQDNLAYLEYHEPEVAAGLSQIKDPYYQIAATYKSVKKFVPQLHKDDQKKMERTQNAPNTLSDPRVSGKTSGETGDYRPRNISQQRKKELWQDMLNSSR